MHAAVAVAALTLCPTPYEILHAESLIRFPELDAGPTVPPLRTRLAAHAAAVRLGLIGPGELVGWGEPPPDAADWLTGFDALRHLHAELADCPPLWTAARLPPFDWCDRAANWNRGLARELRERAVWEPDREAVLQAVAAEADWYAAFWGTASYAAWWGRPSAHARRDALRTLRDMVGAEAFERGEWPDAAPFDRLTPR